ncbi:helix-turn-helix domain-containing protein [Anaerobium acetethylicum]|uniref:Helix-turn-helix domain-containing protein n=1 Tax=Anaerobium acetethylicum TaxID=1619234 RepID=A0A1D3TPV3_9FIRM|nr:helix-turn-helix domain-containing protein [Anaerobium acetethylicum]SCP95408.1 Helix-turn-helix domain-containing protein [Anaerobium acetethylicum]
MAVIRVKKIKNFTVMANQHLRNRNLSLKAKGLLSLMLSLPDDWDYSIRGLAAICKEGVDGIRTTLGELEKQGYLIREQKRNGNGQLAIAEYTILEIPGLSGEEQLELEDPEREKHEQEQPEQEKPIPGKP